MEMEDLDGDVDTDTRHTADQIRYDMHRALGTRPLRYVIAIYSYLRLYMKDKSQVASYTEEG